MPFFLPATQFIQFIWRAAIKFLSTTAVSRQVEWTIDFAGFFRIFCLGRPSFTMMITLLIRNWQTMQRLDCSLFRHWDMESMYTKRAVFLCTSFNDRNPWGGWSVRRNQKKNKSHFYEMRWFFSPLFIRPSTSYNLLFQFFIHYAVSQQSNHKYRSPTFYSYTSTKNWSNYMEIVCHARAEISPATLIWRISLCAVS